MIGVVQIKDDQGVASGKATIWNRDAMVALNNLPTFHISLKNKVFENPSPSNRFRDRLL